MAHTHASAGDKRGSDGADDNGGERHRAGLFDIRTFIAALIGTYGVVLVIMGFVGTSDADIAKSGGININLWAGIGMVVVAALFQAWAMWRPVVVPDNPDDLEESEEERRINEG